MTGKHDNTSGIDLHVSPTVRLVFLLAGILFVLLAVMGAVLPLLPTTPFLLLAVACFARSSERLYQILLNNRVFGPSIRDWHQYHCMRAGIQLLAISMVAVACSSSAWMMRDIPLLSVVTLIAMTGVIGYLSRIPVCQPCRKDLD